MSAVKRTSVPDVEVAKSPGSCKGQPVGRGWRYSNEAEPDVFARAINVVP